MKEPYERPDVKPERINMTEESNKHQGLGRGLSALLGKDTEDFAKPEGGNSIREISVEQLRPSRYQPRRSFSSEEAAALASSVRQRGILQPILVRRIELDDASEVYEIVAGERRWRAAQEAQLHQVPVVIKELTDKETLEVALIENLQREDLLPIDEAEGYRRITEEFGYTQEQLAKTLGKSRSHLTNMMRLLNLPEEVQQMLSNGAISAGHARALVGVSEAVKLAKRIVKDGLSVRQIERLIKDNPRRAVNEFSNINNNKNADTLELESRLSNAIGLPVTIHQKGDLGGQVRVNYRSLEQLDDICHRLMSS